MPRAEAVKMAPIGGCPEARNRVQRLGEGGGGGWSVGEVPPRIIKKQFLGELSSSSCLERIFHPLCYCCWLASRAEERCSRGRVSESEPLGLCSGWWVINKVQ